MAMTVAQAREAAEGAKQTFHELDEGSAGYGSFDLGEMQSSNRKIRELIASYRSGGLEKGTDTGEFIEASILVQADLVEHVRDLFPKWLVEQQGRVPPRGVGAPAPASGWAGPCVSSPWAG